MKIYFGNVQHICAQVDIDAETPRIDLSDVPSLGPFDLVYLGMFLRLYNAEGIAFELTPPADPKVRNYLAGQNFWERFNFVPEVIEGERLHQFTTSTSLNDIIDIPNQPYIGEDVADEVCNLIYRNRLDVDVSGIETLVSELVDNFSLHSGSELAAFAAQYNPNLRRLEFAIGDCGIGIRSSLSANPLYAHLAKEPHQISIREAFKTQVSGRLRGHGGTGFTEVRRTTRRLGGSLRLISGDGYCSMLGIGINSYGDTAYDLSGVQIQLTIPDRESRRR